jgi:hypothetical protein
MCTRIAGRGREHRCESHAQVATHTNNGVSEIALADVIAGIEPAGGFEKALVGPVKWAEVNTHERGSGTTSDRRRSARLS